MKILKPAQCSPGGRRPGGLLLTLALSALLIGSGISGAATTDTSDIRRPLLLAGKQSLYERVLSRPDAQLHAAPGEAGVTTDAFSVFYVYGRKNLDDQTWLEVGSNSHGGVRGWIPESQVLAWNQALTVAFREPVGHDRVLLFRDQATLKSLVDIYDIGSYRKMYKAAEEGDVSANSEVVAIQPKAHVDIHDDFYLVPIKQYQDVFLQNTQALLLNVASVPLPDDKPVAKRDFRSGVVFVVDSTTSMGPYIDRTREVVRGVYDSIQNASLDDKVAFGLIAYRDNNEIVPGLEYLTRTYANLEQGRDPTRFFDAVRDVVPAHVSSKGFVEDAYAGIKRAIEDINWKDYDARYVIVVTDAGPRPGDDPLASTGLSDEGLRQLAQDRGVSIWVMHLLTPQGAADHASAAEQYRAVSSFPGIGEFYYGVGTGDVNRFGQALAQLSGDVTRQVGETARGLPPMPVPEVADDSSELQQLRTRVAKLGNALRLRYLAKQAGETAPDLFDAWLLDHYFTQPEQQSVDVRVLLTRDQLSDLTEVLKRVLATAEEGLLAPKTFLDELKSLAASLSRDPAAVASSTRTTGVGGNLADLGYMREYIEGLPYTGEVMNVSLEDWEDWSAKRQLTFINGLEEKINYYQALHDHTDLWISLDGGPIGGDAVFPVVLNMLP